MMVGLFGYVGRRNVERRTREGNLVGRALTIHAMRTLNVVDGDASVLKNGASSPDASGTRRRKGVEGRRHAICKGSEPVSARRGYMGRRVKNMQSTAAKGKTKAGRMRHEKARVALCQHGQTRCLTNSPPDLLLSSVHDHGRPSINNLFCTYAWSPATNMYIIAARAALPRSWDLWYVSWARTWGTYNGAWGIVNAQATTETCSKLG